MRKKSNFIERSIMGALSFLKESVFADEYASRAGFLQARDPRFSAIGIALLLLAVLLAKSIFFIACVYALCLLLAYLSSVRLGFFLKRTWFFIPLFALFIALPAIFDIFTPGRPVATFRPLGMSVSITGEGLASAAIFFMRVLTSVSLGIILALTTRHYALLKVFRMAGIPQVFVMTLGMCYRYIYLFIGIIQDTYMAIKSRAGSVSSSKRGQRIVAWNIAGLWQRSYKMQGEVYQAMLSRGFDGEVRLADDFRASAKDWAWLGCAGLLLMASIWKSYYSS